MSTPLEAFRAAILGAFPGFDLPRLALARVVRTVADRLSVQLVDARDGATDMSPIEVWPGLPGATSTPTFGELVVVAFVGDGQYPIVLARAAKGEPGSIPLDVKLDAKTSIGLLTRAESAAAKVSVGAAPEALAKAAAVNAVNAALLIFANALAAAVNIGQVAAAGTALSTALGLVPPVPTTKLEAT